MVAPFVIAAARSLVAAGGSTAARAATATAGRSSWLGRIAGGAKNLFIRGQNAVMGAKRAARARRSFSQASVLDKFWTAQAALGTAEKLWEQLDGNLPAFTHSISVTVKGGPEADLRRVWYLTLAAAFGRYRNRALGIQMAMIEATWDVTGKACSVTIGYRNHGLADAIQRAGSFANPEVSSGLGLIQAGPDQVTVGGNWPGFTWTTGQALTNATAAVVGGGQIANGIAGVLQQGVATWLAGALNLQTLIKFLSVATQEADTTTFPDWTAVVAPCQRTGARETPIIEFVGSRPGNKVDIFREVKRNTSLLNTILPWRRVVPLPLSGNRYGSFQNSFALIPELPDDGRVITTGEKLDPRVQNPRPPLDGVSRASLVQLVAQSLQSPCFLPSVVPCSGVIGTPGVRVYPAGEGNDSLLINSRKIQKVVVDQTPGVVGSAFAFAVASFFSVDGYGQMPRSTSAVR